jgi:hypothetical protein
MTQGYDPLHDRVPEGKIDTSVQAFDEMGAKRQQDQARVLGFVRMAMGVPGAEGATCDEICVNLDLLVSTGSARCNDLLRAGLIMRSGRKRLTRAKKSAHVYVIPEGERLVPSEPEPPDDEGEQMLMQL